MIKLFHSDHILVGVLNGKCNSFPLFPFEFERKFSVGFPLGIALLTTEEKQVSLIAVFHSK
jgi:hypothetical protein